MVRSEFPGKCIKRLPTCALEIPCIGMPNIAENVMFKARDETSCIILVDFGMSVIVKNTTPLKQVRN